MGVALLGLDLDFGFLPALQPHPAGQRRGGASKPGRVGKNLALQKKLRKHRISLLSRNFWNMNSHNYTAT